MVLGIWKFAQARQRDVGALVPLAWHDKRICGLILENIVIEFRDHLVALPVPLHAKPTFDIRNDPQHDRRALGFKIGTR